LRSPTTPAKRARAYNLFADGEFDARSVVGLDISKEPMKIQDEEVRRILHELHLQMNSGTDTQTEIDRYMILLYMQATEAPALRALPWQSFVLAAGDVVGRPAACANVARIAPGDRLERASGAGGAGVRRSGEARVALAG